MKTWNKYFTFIPLGMPYFSRKLCPFSFCSFTTSSPIKHHKSFLSTSTLQNPDPISFNDSNKPPNNTHDNILNKSSPFHHHNNKVNDVILSNQVITSFIRSGDLDSALELFNNMTIKTTVTWNSILAGYSRKRGKMKNARELFDKIPEPDTISYNTMLACYVHNSDMEKAQAFFDLIPNKDPASWNTLISGFSQNGKMAKAHKLFLQMPYKNVVTWNAMISGYIACGDLTSAWKLFKTMPVKNVVACTAMITGYMKLGFIKLAEKLFKEMSTDNVVTWNAMISGFIENSRAEDGVKLFRTMVGFGIRPNPSTLSSLLLGCSELSALQLGRQVHQLVCKSPLASDMTAGTSLVSMYCKCGDLEDAWKLFLELPRKDVVTWNAMISGYALHGAGEKALRLFDEMKKEGITPDWITFVAVLLACNHAGFADLGLKYFHSMAPREIDCSGMLQRLLLVEPESTWKAVQQFSSEEGIGLVLRGSEQYQIRLPANLILGEQLLTPSVRSENIATEQSCYTNSAQM
ncbi:pentatricopeptide repeat-containing protein, putative [Ricinus communis]|uniref:Pentatricopeptide repeat-containing protein, putative n=1 Tax=Ricinus communis TaxID=3988 RepID=B9T0L0_RICCO|nr:pentatricopeptide repeat-containing protein, putative [Ricinus communis]